MRFDRCKACKRIVEFRVVRFYTRKAFRKACKRLAEVQSAHFDHNKVCTSLAVFRRVCFVGGLQRFEWCVLTPANHVGGLQSVEEFVLTTAKRVGGLQRLGVCVLAAAKHVGGLHAV